MLIKYVAITAYAFLLNLTLIVFFRHLALRYRTMLSGKIPHVGGICLGISIVAAGLLGLSLSGGLTKEGLGIIIASAAMLIFGILDDRWEFSVAAKFSVEIIAAFLLIALGVKTQIVRIGPLANILITVVWVLGVTNAFNHLDVMDGLAGGSAAIAGLSFFLIAALSGQVISATLVAVLSGALFSFLIFNFPPAKIYLGNAGSHLVGFVLAAVSLSTSYAPEQNKIALLTPILILGLAIFDTGFLAFMRMSNGRSVFEKSNDHLALRFLKQGHTKAKTLALMLGLGVLFSLSGVILARVPSFFGHMSVILSVGVALGISRSMAKIKT
jgi:UDP-GlcNAc:undecaprenyl-phosphate/decaprenyl-phosphate GlcNAc-1-phosphate transferase